MRFIVKFRNGIWQVFDTHAYTVARARDTFAVAAREAQSLNSRPVQRKPRHVQAR